MSLDPGEWLKIWMAMTLVPVWRRPGSMTWVWKSDLSPHRQWSKVAS